jgi:2-methylcitrate dehydratase PrpD
MKNMAQREATEKTALFIEKARFEDIPEAALKQAKLGILDWIAASLAGLKEEKESIHAFWVLLRELGGTPVSTIMGSDFMTSPVQAALVNGFIGHVLDYDETSTLVRSHLTAAVLPAVLALGERNGAPGRDILTGYILGYEVSLRVGQVLTPSWMKLGFHGTSLFGVFGAAAGCGKLLGLDSRKTRHALGMAASMASGIAKNFGSMTKCLHAGFAAKNGVLSALLAEKGFTANETALEGQLGFFSTYGRNDNLNWDGMERMGNPWGLETPGMLNPKLYPCCHGVATDIELALGIREKYVIPIKEIQEIEIHSQCRSLSAMLSSNYLDTGDPLDWGYLGAPRQILPAIPKTGKEGKFSKEYVFARALCEGGIHFWHFTDEAIKDPVIQDLMKKTKVYHNGRLEKISNEHPEETWPYGTRVVIRLKDGLTIEEEEIFTLGAVKRPLSMKAAKRKYYACVSDGLLSREEADQVFEMISLLDKLENISLLMNAFRSYS